MFEGILSYFKKNSAQIQDTEKKLMQGLVDGHIVSTTVGNILVQLSVSFATMGFAYTVIGRHDLLLALASALIGQNHPKIQEHITKVATDIDKITSALSSATTPVSPATPVANATTVVLTEKTTST